MTRTTYIAALLVTVLLGCGSPDLTSEAGLREESKARLSQLDGSITLDGLQEPVEVIRDQWGVAHIYAETMEDLFFTQGFVAAQDRLYQMEIWRRTAAGELSEVFGETMVERDRIARLVRYQGDMEAEWASYSPHAKAIATAFTSGINAYVRQRGDQLPLEFDLLDFRPGEWEPEDVLLRIAGLLMVRNARQEVARAELVAKLGVEQTETYFPTDPTRRLDPDPAVNLDGLDGGVLAGYRSATAIPMLSEEDGSNNWVVDATLTTTGKPLLASDPHRPVVLPSLRYLVHLVAPGWNVIGSGEPALPGVAIGHNERIGWGFTIVQYDQADLYVERTDPENPQRYRYREEWVEMRVERETVGVKGQVEPVEVELKFTRHGPVIWEDPENHRVVVIRWVGQEPGTAGYLGSLALDQAGDWDEFVKAMEAWKVPAENIVYADVDGNIGWVPAGLLPVRPNWSGLFPIPGESGDYAWDGFRTVDQLPREFNPKRHYIATANHNIRPPDYAYDLGFDWSAPYRFNRVDEVLAAGGPFTIEGFQKLQHDETSLPARALTAMLPDSGEANYERARELLSGWNHVLGKDSGAAALFEIWLPILERQFIATEVPSEHRELIARNLDLPVLIDLLSRSGEHKAVLRQSLGEAWSHAADLLGPDPAAWRWGTLHTINFRHPLASTPARRAVFNRGPVERGGDGYTPNATPGSDFQQRNGASYRHILDLADWDRSVFTSTPGQSGQPGSPFYDNLLDGWGNHSYAPLVYSREAVERHAAHTLTLEPR
jgi:penicillin G amidase